MSENRLNEAGQEAIKTMREANQAFISGLIAGQERNMRYVQSMFENGVEVLKSHAEGTRVILQTALERKQEPQALFQTMMEASVAAQERNMRYVQNVFENGVEVLRSHAESTRNLMQTLVDQSKEQQETFLTQHSMDAYLDLLYAPFSYYKRFLDTTQMITEQTLDVARKAAQQSMEHTFSAVRQGQASPK